jgi:LPXTG-motif cell wall-anchored protein
MMRRLVALALVATAAVLGLAGPGAAQEYPPGPLTLTVAPPSPVAGDSFVITVTGADGAFTVAWSPARAAGFVGPLAAESGQVSGTATDGAGAVTATIEEAGTYTLVATGKDTDGNAATGTATLTVQPDADGSGDGDSGAGGSGDGGDGLADTGARTMTLAAIAAGAILLGSLALVVARRRRRVDA